MDARLNTGGFVSIRVKGQSHSENAWITHELRTDFRFCAERASCVDWTLGDLSPSELRASHTAKTHESRTNYAHIFVSARSVRRVRNSSVERTWTVSDCKCMCVEGGLCVIWVLNGSKFFKMCVIHASGCIVYASSMRDYARDTRRPSVLMRRNWFETAHVHVRPTSTSAHWRPTFISRMNRAHITFIPLTSTDSVIHASGVRRMFVEYCTVFARIRRRARYVRD